jgi:hypothetical protein
MRIICCGNPERGDDGAGALVAERLRDFRVEAEIRSGEALDVIEAGVDSVVVVDAVETGSPLASYSRALAQPKAHSASRLLRVTATFVVWIVSLFLCAGRGASRKSAISGSPPLG